MTKDELIEALKADGWTHSDETKPVAHVRLSKKEGSRMTRAIVFHPDGVRVACALSLPTAQVAASFDEALAWAKGEGHISGSMYVNTLRGKNEDKPGVEEPSWMER